METVSSATVETTSTRVATQPPWRVPYRFCTRGRTGNTHTNRPGVNSKSCAGDEWEERDVSVGGGTRVTRAGH